MGTTPPQVHGSIDTPLGLARSNLNAVHAFAGPMERAYIDARLAFLMAARDLKSQGAKFAKRAADLEALGGSHELDPPMSVVLVTQDEVDAAVAELGW